MINEAFSVGPFTLRPEGRKFSIGYGSEPLFSDIPVEPGTRAQIVEQLDERLSDARRGLRECSASELIYLVDAGEEHLARFSTRGVLPEMTPGLIDDRSPYWLQSSDGRYSLDVTLDEYAILRSRHELPEHAWIADLLPDDITTLDADGWRAPSSWELRHVVGEGSLTGVSGAKAAALVGVNPQSFRKYTAREGASSRQNISFAMWHLLLHRLNVQRMP